MLLSFELDEDQKMLTQAVSRFAEERIRNAARDADEEGEIPVDVIRDGWALGLLPTSIPEEYGGFGEHSVVTGALAIEALAYGDLAIALNIGVPALVAVPIMLNGTEAQKESYLAHFCTEAIPHVSAALTEPVVQFDPRALGTTAVLNGDGYLLNGSKAYVPLADSAEIFLIYAAENGQTQAFLVPGDSNGMELGPRSRLMGIRGLPTYNLTLNDVQVPAGNRLGGAAGIDFDRILSHSRVAAAAAAVGVAKAGYDYARDYAKNRVQFGEPIAHRQSIAFMLAEMAIDVDAARLLVWEAAWKLDQGQCAVRETTVMKQYVDDMVIRVADRAVQALGGYGYIREYPVEMWLRNARGFTTFDGLAIV